MTAAPSPPWTVPTPSAGAPWRSALDVALLRAAHQVVDAPPVFRDPLALPIVGARSETAFRADPRVLTTAGPVRAFVAARSRYAEDSLAEALAAGVDQYLVLGAGLDTWACRHGAAPGAPRVFEVDHPEAQDWKRACLRAAGIADPPALAWVPVDFGRESLAGGLAAAGFRADRPAFVSLLGVAIFLDQATLMATLGWVAALPAGSGIVFDFSVPTPQLSPAQRRQREAGAALAARAGEPWRTFLDAAWLEGELLRMGYRRAGTLTPAEINRRYLADRADGLSVELGGRRIMAAWR